MSVNFKRGEMFKKKAYTSGGSNRTPLSAVSVRIVSYHIAGKKSDPTKDYAVGVLLHATGEGADRIEPTYASYKEEAQADGTTTMVECAPEEATHFEPTLEVKLFMPEMEGKRRARIIFTMEKGYGLAKACPVGTQVIFEKAKLVPGPVPTFEAQYATGGPTPEQRGVTAKDASGLEVVDMNAATKQLFSDMLVSVLPEKSWINKRTTEREYQGRPDVLIADPQDPRIVENDEQLRAQVDGILEQGSYGTPGFMLLARKLAPVEMTEFAEQVAFARNGDETRLGGCAVAKPKLQENEDKNAPNVWVPRTTDEVLELLWEGSESIKAVWGQPGWQFEVVPLMSVNQAKSMVPSLPENEGNTDNSVITSLYGYAEEGQKVRDGVQTSDNRTIGIVMAGWTRCHVMVRRPDTESTFWFTDYQAPMNQNSGTVEVHDVKTAATPDYHAAAIDELAGKLGVQKNQYYQARSQARAAAAPAPAPAAAPAAGPAPGR